MPATPSNPHDAYFRHVLARPADAACELRAALPDSLTERIDWAQLHLQPGSFVSTELRSRYSDLLYRTRLDGHPAYIYLLIEHQSRSDRFMPLRILEYLVNIWNQHRNHYPRARTLPAVLPLVVHSNSRGDAWNAPTEMSDLFDIDPVTHDALQPYLPRFRFVLDDIAAIDLAALRNRDLTPATRVMLALHKIAPHNAELGTDLLELLDDLRILANGPQATAELQAVMTYILIVGETDEHDLDPLIEQLGPRAKEAAVTTAERLRAEARAEERVSTLIELLTVKFGSVPEATLHTIRAATSDQVHTWLRRLITATSLDQVFA
ncbi:Rpn family recombination-promoting nuclease/putative transposase [Nocardia carnea]|uniref:Rpn family recombination-promoting nuclease/putative transposase n=1 Tax=Nocardia carnea TaxID=37328 RepID=UPI002455AE41|nr:Rpn family recombination-promoting nuclease/putative transposase [Nocardia carnea]